MLYNTVLELLFNRDKCNINVILKNCYVTLTQ